MLERWQAKILLAFLVALPGLLVRLTGTTLDPLVAVALYGSSVVAAAFILAWAAEAAEVDVSAGLAVAVLAFIAVLPEYAVDLYFAYTSGHRPDYAQYAAANMTGSNRLLIGVGWPLVVFVFALAARRCGRPRTDIQLDSGRRVELAFLLAAGLYAFIIPLTGRLTLLDGVVLVGLFGLYMRRLSLQERGEPELIGVAACLGALPQRRRRIVVGGLFIAAAVFVVAAAKPFADGLVETGKQFGFDEFLLVQWLAPLASEAPELIVAALLAWKGKSSAAIGVLLSSKVNQWTLLVGSIPLAHLVGGGGLALHLDGRQTEEFLLTAAQTLLGLAVLVDLRFSTRDAGLLLGLFALQFLFPQTAVRLAFSAAYLVLALVLLARRPGDLRQLLRVFWSIPQQAVGKMR